MDVLLWQEQLRTLAVSLALGLFINYIAYWQGYYSLPAKDEERAVNISFSSCFLAFLAYFLGQLSFMLVALLSLKQATSLSASAKAWLAPLALISGTTALSFYLFLFESKNVKKILGPKDKALYHFSFGLLSFLISFPGYLFLSTALTLAAGHFFGSIANEQTALEHFKASFSHGMPFILTFLALAVLAPISEELLFRGLLQNALYKRWGQGASIAITSFIFALFHFSFSQGKLNFILLPLIFYISCYFGFIYEKQKSLWACIGFHVFFNFLNALFSMHA